jgi:hypothetical protein
MNKLSIKLVAVFFWLLAIGFSLWLMNKNFPWTGQLVIQANLVKDQPMISRLGPPERLKIMDNMVAMTTGPVYFDLRFLPWFKTARIKLVFQSVRQQPIMGSQIGPGFNYAIKKPFLVSDLGNGFWQAIFDFNLALVYQKRNITRFLIDLEELSGDDKFRIKNLEIILSR